MQDKGARNRGAQPGRGLPGGTHVVSRCVGLHGVLSRQGNAAHGNDHEDAHLKVAQVQDVMAQAAQAVGDTWVCRGLLRSWASKPFPSVISLFHLPLPKVPCPTKYQDPPPGDFHGGHGTPRRWGALSQGRYSQALLISSYPFQAILLENRDSQTELKK